MQMPQSLSVGLTALTLGWKRILQQEGIEFRQCDFCKKISPSDFAVVIANSRLNEKQAQNAIEFMQKGGAILAAYDFFSQIDDSIKFKEKKIRFIEPKGVFFNGAGLLWLNQSAAIFEGQKQPLPLLKKIGNGFMIALPFDPESATMNEAFERKGFFAGKAVIAEFAPAASKTNSRIIASNCIKRLFELRGFPFLHLWYYPKQFKSVFSFHVDVDDFSKEVLPAIKLFKELGFQPTWFLNMQAAEKAESSEIISELKRQPFIGQHAFEHIFFADSGESYGNVMKGHLEMEKLGFNPNCFSAPNGVWSQGIARAVQALGYDFAVAFSLDSDNLPFNPIVEGKEAGFLFLPTHPICIGLLKMYDFNEREMIDYFNMIIERNASAALPLLLYGHPFEKIGSKPDVIKSIFSAVRARKDIWVATHQQFLQWWEKRQVVSFKAILEGNKVKIICNTVPDASIRVVFDGRQSFLTLKNQEAGVTEFEKGKPVFSGTIKDTMPKPSFFGKKHLAKKAGAWVIKNIFRKKI
jgi:hypothetical protein